MSDPTHDRVELQPGDKVSCADCGHWHTVEPATRERFDGSEHASVRHLSLPAAFRGHARSRQPLAGAKAGNSLRIA
jgi:hypothetical protein